MLIGRIFVAIAVCVLATVNAGFAKPIQIVAIGASNTQGWYVRKESAYPAKLEALLRENGINATVANAGVPFDTTAGMLKRIETDVPHGTDIVILQPGGNDRRFLVSGERRAANIAAMVARLRARGIESVVYDEEIPSQYYTFDFIHLTANGHAFIASRLLPRLLSVINRTQRAK